MNDKFWRKSDNTSEKEVCMIEISGGGQICTESIYIEAKKVVQNLY